MKEVIKVCNLKKKYGGKEVLKGISFKVEEGSIFALLGTNGAGKTTTLECIEGIRKYNSGDIVIDGKIGVQLQTSSLQEEIKGIEALKLFALWNKTAVDLQFVERLGLEGIVKKNYKSMSTGEKRRLHLALAMTGNPDIVFLDEPTAGLDVEGRVSLHEEIRKLKSHGKTIVMASHDMAEVESLCDKLVILKNGEIAFLGTVNELTSRIKRTYKIFLKLDKEFKYDNSKNYLYKGIEKGYYIFESDNIADGLIELLSLIKKSNRVVSDIKIENSSLEDSFIDIAKETV